MTSRQRIALRLHRLALKLAPEIAAWYELQIQAHVQAAIAQRDAEAARQFAYIQRTAEHASRN